MKTLLTSLIILILTVSLSAVNGLINFNNPSNVTNLLNHATGTAISTVGNSNAGSHSGKIANSYVKNSESASRAIFSGAGAGTVASPYIITSPGQLNEVRNFHDSHFILGNDLDLNVSPYNSGEGWVPLGEESTSRTELDLSLATGGSFTITAMGMFGDTTTAPIYLPTDAGEIQNAIMNADIMVNVFEVDTNKYSFSNFISLNLELVVGTATTQEFATYPFSGVFDGNNKTISNLYINRATSQRQGLFAYTEGATLMNLTLNNIYVAGAACSGGLLAEGHNTVLTNCHANGTISTGLTANCGGLAANLENEGDLQIDNCSSTGSVTGNSWVGGLFGACSGSTLNRCFSTSNITNPYGGSNGGLIGNCTNTNLNNCYAMGTVTGSNRPHNGGLIGFVSNGTATNCYSTGAVITPDIYSTGGLFGYTRSFSATGCYWDTVTSGRSNATGSGDATATGRNTDEMTYPYDAFTGWDFATIWNADVSNANGGYPMLRWGSADYPDGNDVPVGEAVVTVIGGDAYNGSGIIPDISSLGIVPVQTFTFVATGILRIEIITTAQIGIFRQAGVWYGASNSQGMLILNIDFDAVGKGEVPVILANEAPTLPVEFSAFDAIPSADYDSVILSWTVESETNHLGYDMMRSYDNELSHALKVNSSIITEGSHNGTQVNYQYNDSDLESGNSYYYWLASVSLGGIIDYYGPISVNLVAPPDGNDPPLIPVVTSLQKAFPNPFNPSVTITYGLAKAEFVQISIYNNKGQKIRTLLNETQSPGQSRVSWNGINDQGSSCSSGIYYIRMTAGQYHTTQKIIMMK